MTLDHYWPLVEEGTVLTHKMLAVLGTVFANPEIYEFLEAEGMGYTIRLPANSVCRARSDTCSSAPSADLHMRCAGTGRRVLKGLIRRGVADRISAVLWYSDLREFTRIT